MSYSCGFSNSRDSLWNNVYNIRCGYANYIFGYRSFPPLVIEIIFGIWYLEFGICFKYGFGFWDLNFGFLPKGVLVGDNGLEPMTPAM